MSESPKSADFPLRYETPVEGLDDHRFQSESLPRAEGSMGTHGRPRLHQEAIYRAGSDPINSGTPTFGPRRLTIAEGSGLPPITDINQAIIARDFECAVEDGPEISNPQPRRPAITLQVPTHRSEENAGEESTAHSTAARNNNFRRSRLGSDRFNRSTTSLNSDRTISPSNSVDAFASPRSGRDRAGTAQSAAAPNISAPISSVPRSPHIAPSFHRERRPSIRLPNNENFSIGSAEDSPHPDSVEDDVCFPQPEEQNSKVFSIDYDELHDFVNENKHVPTNVPLPFGDKQGFSGYDHRSRFLRNIAVDNRTASQAVGSAPQRQGHRFSISKYARRPSVAHTLDDSSSDDLEKEKEKKPDNLEGDADGALLDQIIRFSFFSSALEDTIHAPELGDLLMPGETFQNLFELGEDGGVWWLDMLMPSEEEVEAICKAFGVHGLTREDIIQQETHEKVELFKSYYFVCFRSFFQMDKSSDCYLEPVNVYAVVFREGILTFTFCPSPHAANVRKRMGRLRDYVSLGSDWICYALIDDIVDSYQPVIREVEIEVDTIEDNVFTARMEDMRAILKQIGESRKIVTSVSRLLGGKADVIKGFAKRCNEQYLVTPRQDVGLYLSDIQDHVVTMMSNLSHFEKQLSRSHSNYIAQISLDNIAQGNRANEVLSKVTFIATILVPLNLVCGLFGMNVEVPGKNATGLGWFFGIVGFLALFIVTGTVIAKRMRFI